MQSRVVRNGEQWKLERLNPEALEMVAARFRVLGEPVRLRLLQELASGERSVSELAGLLETTQPNVSKHLRLLQDAGLVSRRQEKNSAYFSVSDETIYALTDLVCMRIQERLAAQALSLGQLETGRTRRRRRAAS